MVKVIPMGYHELDRLFEVSKLEGIPPLYFLHPCGKCAKFAIDLRINCAGLCATATSTALPVIHMIVLRPKESKMKLRR